MNLKKFLDNSPTAWHACANAVTELNRVKYSALDETEAWKIKPAGRYFVMRNDGSIIAFITPRKCMQRIVTVAAHTDSPGLKLKPHGEYTTEGIQMLHFEVYGAPILPSWIGRDLYLAGRIFSEEKRKIISQLVSFRDYPFMLPNLAFHLDRQVNEDGLLVNKQEQLAALVSTDGKPFLERLFKTAPLHHELFAVPCEASELLGFDHKLLASARLDNLSHAASGLEALLNESPDDHALKVLALFNFEEIGSQTQEGAASTFFNDTLERLFSLAGFTQEERLRCKASSATLSCDVTHAVHPNHVDRYDARHHVRFGAGLVIKTSAQCRYVTDAQLAATIASVLKKKKIAFQYFSPRNDIPPGSTIGPIHAANTGIKTIDIGIPILGMHAARELMHVDDYDAFVRALHILYNAL